MRSFLLLLLVLLSVSLKSQHRSSSENYLPNTLMVKVKSQYAAYCNTNGITHPEIIKILNAVKATSIKKEHPNSRSPKKPYNNMGIKLADLSLIYKLEYSSAEDPKLLGQKLAATGFFEYAEPFFLHELLFNPNDPEIGLQWHLTNINAYQAWDVNQGDTNIVIGISDTGIEPTHNDLSGNIKHNYNDPIDNIDNDGDGFIDNFSGWDIGEKDNDPTWNTSKHGHLVAGTAAAVTNNGLQNAGVGFKTKILPLKVTNASGSLVGTYSSIIYAADHGVNIINCSWGSVGSWSQYGQDVITYASINKNCLVVCAGGNDNNEGFFYPASFDWALSVGGTDVPNTKWVSNPTFGSNYNEHIDICAPGRNLHVLDVGNATISGQGGTSQSAPIVSGAAAIAWSNNLSYTGMQIGELLKATADSLDFIPGNGPYAGKLGEGLVNMNRSVTESGFPGLYLYNFSFTDNNQNNLSPGDTVKASGILYNFLASSGAGTKVEIRAKSPYIKMIDSVLTVGSIPTSNGLDLSSTPFKFVVLPGMPVGASVGFIFTTTDGSYNTKRYAEQSFNVDYINLEVNKLKTSIGASGKMGYNALGVQFPGLGVRYDSSSSLLYQMGLMISDTASQVSFMLDGDFNTEKDMRISPSGSEADFDIYTHFNDDSAKTKKMMLSVKQKTLAWTATEREKFILVEYTIFNNSAKTYNNLHIGTYADWDIGTYSNNQANFDASTQIAYANEIGGLYGGIHLLDSNNVQHYAFDNDGSNGSHSIYDGFDETEQFNALTSGNSRSNSGTGDVSHLIGNGPYTLLAGDSMTYSFALLVGDSLQDLQKSALEADSAYDEIRNLTITVSNTTNPSCKGFCDGSISISSSNGVGSHSYLWNDQGAQTSSNATGLCAGTYQCIVTDSIGQTDTIKNIVLTDPASLAVNLGNDTTLCGGDSHALDAGHPGEKYLWNTADTNQTRIVDAAGLYHVTVTNGIGCTGRDTIQIFVNSNPSVDIGNDTAICSNQSITFDAANTGLNFLWSSGTNGQTETFSSAGTHWVKVTNFTNCSTTDSVTLTVHDLPSVNLGADINACDSYSDTLDAGNAGASYLWNTGSTAQKIAVNSAGSYHVKVTTGGICEDNDTININIEPTPNINLGQDTTVCKSAAFQLDAGNGVAYLWNTGETTQKITTYSSGEYHVLVGTHCTDRDTIIIDFHQSPTVWNISGFNTERNSAEEDVILDFGRPAGGVYSGNGVSGNIFNTLSSGDGLHKIDYTYTNPDNGCSATTWVTIDVNPTVTVSTLDNGPIKIFPNPFNKELQISWTEANLSNQVNIQLYDGQGKLVLSKSTQAITNGETTISTQHLSKGMYHLVLSGGDTYQSFKVIK